MPTKIGARNSLIYYKKRNDNTYIINFISNVLNDEIIVETLLEKIYKRDIEKLRKEQEEKDKLKEIEREKRRLYRERKMPYPQERYDACIENLERYDVDYLNIVLDNIIGKSMIESDYVQSLIKSFQTYILKKQKLM